MKRDGYIIDEIIDVRNLEQSFDTVVRGTKRKESREGKWLLANREQVLEEIKNKISDGSLSVSKFHPKLVYEGNKWRNIQVFSMKDRIAVNAVMTVVDKHLKKRFIRTSGASIKNRGMHDLKAYIARDMELYPNEMKYFYKFDVRKFYESVSHDFVMYCVRKIFKDKKLIDILDRFVRLLPNGISIGLRSSQGLGNLLLSIYLDHYLKDRYSVKHFYRYCDDGVIASGCKLFLWDCRDAVHELINGIELTVKPNDRVFPNKEGLDFLGYVTYPTHSMLRKRIKKNFAEKLSRIKSRKRRKEVIGSLWGMAKHCNSIHLMETLLYPSEFNKVKRKIKKERMKNFSELNIRYNPPDGKKRFPSKTAQLRTLINVKIEVLDFEQDVITKYGPRWLVLYRDTRTNEMSKFFTDCDEMKQALVMVQEANEIPFMTVIGVEYFGDNKSKYKFT